MSYVMAWKSKHIRILGVLFLLAGVVVLLHLQTASHLNVTVQELQHSVHQATLQQESPDVFHLLPEHYLADYKSFCWYDLQKTFRCLPKVYLAGMPKCGSTDLYSKIVWHPDLHQPPCGKENHYWARSRVGKPTNHLKDGQTNKQPFKNYLKQMGAGKVEGKREQVLIDGTQSLLWDLLHWESRYPEYTNPPYNNAELIHAVAPDSKIIVIVRDPVDRLYSDYLYFNGDAYGLHENRTAQSFDNAIKKEMGKMSECMASHSLRRCCYDSENDPKVRLHLGIYICYIRDWYELFGDNLLVVTLEDYSKQPLPVLYRIFSFIRVPEPEIETLSEYISSTKIQNTRSKSDSSLGAMLSATRKLLHDFYRPYNVQLARLLNDTRFLYDSS